MLATHKKLMSLHQRIGGKNELRVGRGQGERCCQKWNEKSTILYLGTIKGAKFWIHLNAKAPWEQELASLPEHTAWIYSNLSVYFLSLNSNLGANAIPLALQVPSATKVSTNDPVFFLPRSGFYRSEWSPVRRRNLPNEVKEETMYIVYWVHWFLLLRVYSETVSETK